MNNQYLFNVRYYDGLYTNNIEGIASANNELIAYKLNTNDIPMIEGKGNIQCFHLQTVYPGLLIGTGNPHSSGNSSDEIKLGFTLDYTTGLPYIPGSTVKGTIRSLIKENDKKKGNETAEHFEVRKDAYKNRLEYVRDVIEELTTVRPSDNDIKSFENETFGNGEDGKGDIFFDAYPVRGGRDRKLFAFESITPHNALKNPVPLRLLKIIPGVVFEFRFSIRDSKTIPEMTSDKKEEFFKRILLDFGIGAKTNVGFGALEPFVGSLDNNADCDSGNLDNHERQSAANNSEKKAEIHKYIVGTTYTGRISGHNKSGLYAYVNLDDGGTASFRDDGKMTKNQQVTLLYKGQVKGKDERFYNNWVLKQESE